jgi:hypothetical protein
MLYTAVCFKQLRDLVSQNKQMEVKYKMIELRECNVETKVTICRISNVQDVYLILVQFKMQLIVVILFGYLVL